MTQSLPDGVRRMVFAVSMSPRRADLRIDQTRAGREHFARLFAEHPARHVEIMDRHVLEQAAADRDVAGEAAARDRGW